MSIYSTAQQQHDMLFLHLKDPVCPRVVSCFTVSLKAQTKTGLTTTSISIIAYVSYIYLVIYEDVSITLRQAINTSMVLVIIRHSHCLLLIIRALGMVMLVGWLVHYCGPD